MMLVDQELQILVVWIPEKVSCAFFFYIFSIPFRDLVASIIFFLPLSKRVASSKCRATL